MVYLLLCCVLSPVVPGASDLDLVSNINVRNRILEGARQPLSVISDDGECLFVNEGKFARYSLGRPVREGSEDVFYSLLSGVPRSFTTSQSAHYKRGSDYMRTNYRSRSIVAAPSAKQILLGAKMSSGLRLSIVNLEERGSHPNRDTELPTHGAIAFSLLSANHADNSMNWFTLRQFPNKPSKIEHVKFTGGKRSVANTWVCAPGEWDYYEAGSGTLIATRADEHLGSAVFIGRRDNYQAIKTSYPNPSGQDGLKHAFLSRGKIFAQTDRLYVRDSDRKWKPYGSNFVVLAKSANDKYWLILDKGDQTWKVTF